MKAPRSRPEKAQRILRRGMYGDFVTAVAAVVFIPFYWYLLSLETAQPLGAALVTTCATGSSVLSWISWTNNDPRASLGAVVGHAALTIVSFFYEWPFYGRSIAFPSLLWMLLRSTMNFSLPFNYKLISGLLTLASTLVTTSSARSPIEELTESLPMYLGVTVVYIVFHYFAQQEQTGKQKAVTARAASILLAGSLAYHYSYEISRMYSSPEKILESSYSMLQAAFFAAFGFTTAGAFSEQVDISEALELKVQERTREIIKQERELHIIGMVLEASETAIAIVDEHQRIEWSNPALLNILHKDKKANLVGFPLLDAFSLSKESLNALQCAFDSTTETETEIVVKNCFYRVCVAPIPDEPSEDCKTISGSPSRFVVALKDVTAQRGRENSEKKAAKEELLKKAMLNSMEALSHEVRE
jgi:PAS domain-containing protein